MSRTSTALRRSVTHPSVTRTLRFTRVNICSGIGTHHRTVDVYGGWRNRDAIDRWVGVVYGDEATEDDGTTVVVCCTGFTGDGVGWGDIIGINEIG